MMIVGHSAIGASIGLLIPNPYVAFVVGVISHHVADYIPHFDVGSFTPPEKREQTPNGVYHYTMRDYLLVALDLVLTAAMLWVFFHQIPEARYASVAAGILGANLPDLFHNVPIVNLYTLKVPIINKWRLFHHGRFQTTVLLKNWYWGVLTQLVAIGFAFWLFLR